CGCRLDRVLPARGDRLELGTCRTGGRRDRCDRAEREEPGRRFARTSDDGGRRRLLSDDRRHPQALPGDPRDGPARAGLRGRRLPAGGSIVEAAVDAASSVPEGTRAVVALEGAPTRALSSTLRKQLGMPKESVHALAYWTRRVARGPVPYSSSRSMARPHASR